LGKRFDYQNSRHNRMVRKVPKKKWFVYGHILDCHNGFTRIAFQDSINKQKRVPVRQVL
jgi:hypothetical protein